VFSRDRPRQRSTPAQYPVQRVGMFDRAAGFGDRKLRLQRAGDPRRDLVLQGEQVADIAVETLGPELRTGFGIDELDIDPYLVAGPLYAALEDVTHAQFSADPLDVIVALVGESGVAGDHQASLDARDVGRQIFGDPISEILLPRVVAEIGERQDNNRQPGRGARLSCRCRFRTRCALAAGPQPPASTSRNDQDRGSGSSREDAGADQRPSGAGSGCCRPAVGGPGDLEGPHGLGDVLDPLLAERGEPDRHTGSDKIAYRTGKTHSAWLGERLQPGNDVDPVAKEV